MEDKLIRAQLSHVIVGLESLSHNGVQLGLWRRLTVDSEFAKQVSAAMIECDRAIPGYPIPTILDSSVHRTKLSKMIFENRISRLDDGTILMLGPGKETSHLPSAMPKDHEDNVTADMFLIRFHRTIGYHEALAELSRRGLRPADVLEGLWFVFHYNNQVDHPIQILGAQIKQGHRCGNLCFGRARSGKKLLSINDTMLKKGFSYNSRFLALPLEK